MSLFFFSIFQQIKERVLDILFTPPSLIVTVLMLLKQQRGQCKVPSAPQLQELKRKKERKKQAEQG